jgi:hypothetical protein
LANDAPTTVAAKLPQRPTILPTTFAAGFNDVPNDGCRKKRRSGQRWLPQGSTKCAAAANDRRRKKCRHRVSQKNRPKNSPGKDRLLGVGSLGSRRVVANFHVRCAAGRHWPSQVAYALWRRAAHRDCPPHDWPPVQSPFHLAAAAAPVLRLGSGASVVPSASTISMPLLLF